jgi:hypothetical protein
VRLFPRLFLARSSASHVLQLCLTEGGDLITAAVRFAEVDEPMAVEVSESPAWGRVVGVSCGAEHSAFWTANGELWTFGRDHCGVYHSFLLLRQLCYIAASERALFVRCLTFPLLCVNSSEVAYK